MQLGITPVQRRVTQEDLSLALHEITMRVPNETLKSLARTPLWSAVAVASRDVNWWFARTQQLLAEAGIRRLPEWRVGDWNRVYKSLALYGPTFDARHNYRSTLLVQVLLEIGADPAQNKELVGNVTRDDNAEALSILLADPRIDVTNYRDNPIWIAARRGRADVLKVLLADGRIDPDADENLPFTDAVDEHETECVRLLLADPRVDPSDQGNKALLTAATYGYADIVELLLSDEQVQDREDEMAVDDYGLERAMLGSHADVVKLILGREDLQFLSWSLTEACKGSSFETVKLLFDDPRSHPADRDNAALKYARKRRDRDARDIETLLLSDPGVRDLDEKQKRGENWWD